MICKGEYSPYKSLQDDYKSRLLDIYLNEVRKLM